MTNYVRKAAGTPLTDEEMAQLRALAEMPNSEIDFSDIPESTTVQLQGARRRNVRRRTSDSADHLEKAS